MTYVIETTYETLWLKWPGNHNFTHETEMIYMTETTCETTTTRVVEMTCEATVHCVAEMTCGIITICKIEMTYVAFYYLWD
jgi:hypothetical protein